MAAGWRHVFKLDPNRALSDLALKMICLSETDAIVVGGTDGITFANTSALLERIRRYSVPCVQEVSDLSSVVPGFDGYLIPTVLNTEEMKWAHGMHFEAIRQYGDLIPWERCLLLGYVILNPDAKVSRLTKADALLQEADVTAYARLIEHLFEWPVMYIEYSGRFGDPQMVLAARKQLKRAQLFYGGGISNREQAEKMAELACTVVVGNLVYRNVEMAVRTVKWVQETKKRLTEPEQGPATDKADAVPLEPKDLKNDVKG
ncbi:heptaprenylglyceryl phosphate synthase [Thermoactinomyces sp. CICC 10523]|nr:heptaprenylglyceryl phosphate synthase [Thermoactinomyces sp. CICC 10523]